MAVHPSRQAYVEESLEVSQHRPKTCTSFVPSGQCSHMLSERAFQVDGMI